MVKVPDYNIPRVSRPKKSIDTELVLLRNRLAVANEKIKQLEALRSELRSAIRANHKQTRCNELPLEIDLYALELEDGCYYVGLSRDVDRRYVKHCRGKGAMWTKKHKPLRIIETRPTGLTDESAASKLEDTMTIQYALRYGSQRVRGGGFCQTKPRWPDRVLKNDLKRGRMPMLG